MKKSAVISDCNKYRYSLTRIWDETKEQIIFIGLNPSTADAEKDDPTIKKLIRICQRLGYGGFEIVNLFAYRATDPKDIPPLTHIALGPRNQELLDNRVRKSGKKVICMWGKHNKVDEIHSKQMSEVCRHLGTYCFKINNDGSPAHPLFLSDSIRPIKWK